MRVIGSDHGASFSKSDDGEPAGQSPPPLHLAPAIPVTKTATGGWEMDFGYCLVRC